MDAREFDRGQDREQEQSAIARLASAIGNAVRAAFGTSAASANDTEDSDRARVSALQSSAASELPRGDGEVVMIVDGDSALVLLAEQMLARLGYRPSGFDSGPAALDALQAEPAHFDAVLIDDALSAPGVTVLAREIRRLRADIPIVLMSCRSDAECQAAGVNGRLRKPLLSCEIAAPLTEILAGRRR